MDRLEMVVAVVFVFAFSALAIGLGVGAVWAIGGFDENRHNTYDFNLGGREYVCKNYPNRSNLTVCKPTNRNIPLP